MDHKALIKSLSPELRADLTRKTNHAGLKHLSLHLGWILVLGCYVASGAPLWWVTILPLGICIVFLFTLLHETVHFTPFENARLNAVVGHICSVVVIVPNTWFRYFHLAHHKYTNDPLHDPELETSKPESRRAYAWHISGLPYWRAMLRTLVRAMPNKFHRYVA